MGYGERVSRRAVVRAAESAEEFQDKIRASVDEQNRKISESRGAATVAFDTAKATAGAFESFRQRGFWARLAWLILGR